MAGVCWGGQGGDRARRMALVRRRRSLALCVWTMVTFTAMPYRSTTPYTTSGVSVVATPGDSRRDGVGGLGSPAGSPWRPPG